jgi:putative ABC transport system permease protein
MRVDHGPQRQLLQVRQLRQHLRLRVGGIPILSAARALGHDPGASFLSIGTMAAGIGLATAMLAVLNGTIWHPLPFAAPERLVAIQGPVSSATVTDWSSAARSFDGIVGYRSKRYTLTGAGDAVSLRATVETGGLFELLRVQAARGRVIHRGDARAAALVAVLSDDCWRTAFHGDPTLPGRPVYLNGTPFVVVGVLPRGVQFPVNAEPIDVYTTTAADLQTDRRPSAREHPRDLMVVGRLKSGVPVTEARAEMGRIRAADEPVEARREARRTTLVVPLASDVAAAAAAPVTALSWAVAGVVIIACVTAAILSLIRVTSRGGEWATRLAIGATPGHLVRQVLAESLAVAVVGGLLGAILASMASRPLLLLAGNAANVAARTRFDGRVWAWAAALTGACAASFGAIPSVVAAATRWSPSQGRQSSGRQGAATRNILVTVEVAVAVVLLAACISLLRAYTSLAGTDTGFAAGGATTFRVDLSDRRYPASSQAVFFEQLRSAAAAAPGVRAAGFTVLPPFGDLRFTIRLDRPGGGSDGHRSVAAEVNLVSPDYFRTMGIPVVAGREFSRADAAGRDPVTIISQTAATRLFPGQDPVGRSLDVRLGPGARGTLPTVVAVVGDTRSGTLTAPVEPQVYLPYSQAPMMPSTTFVVRVSDERRAAALSAIRGQLRRLDADVPIVNLRPLDAFVSNATSVPRFTTALAAVFAAAAVFLSMSGVYAVVAYAALCRRREFAIRRALGATESGIAGLVLRQCLKVLVPGLVTGAGGALALGRGLESALYGVHPSSTPTLVATVGLATILALLAAWQPARTAGGDELQARLQSGA